MSLRRFDRFGPYPLPRPPGGAAARAGEPDLTEFAAVHAGEVRFTAGRRPGAVSARGGVVEVAVPEAAARRLGSVWPDDTGPGGR
ncbi:hypothetical protein [Streptomyces roseolilacinus]|uniref:hypothetical protein n=1 Tax=Streptomyces roseolilacinus TaxID=66904 RepID=UPI0037FDDBEE